MSEEFRSLLAVAVDTLDCAAAEALAADLSTAIRNSSGLHANSGVAGVLDSLRKLRLYRPMINVAEAAFEADSTQFVARRQYGQALIEGGALAAALGLLQALVLDTEGADSGEHAEARGLVGRVHKQAYVSGGGGDRYRDRLRLAVDTYFQVYDEDRERNQWHGINAVALLFRAEQDGVSIDGFPDRRKLAAELLAAARSADPTQPWNVATAMEAAVGVGDFDQALVHAYTYVSHPRIDAFMLASTLRQMTEVWGLGRGVNGPRHEQEIVDLLRAHLLGKEKGGLTLPPGEIFEGAHPPDGEDRHLQAVLDNTAYVKVQWYRLGLTASQAVAKVSDGPNAFGTGFLMWSDALGFEGDRRPLFVTNNHVLSSDADSTAAHADVAAVIFETASISGFETTVSRVLWEHPRTGLDVTVAELRELPSGVEPLSLAPGVPRDTRARLYAIGYPLGGDLCFSLQDNHLLAVRPPLIQYRTPTAGGSSGSPILNQSWRVVGLHRAGGLLPRLNGPGYHTANEGILIRAVQQSILDLTVPFSDSAPPSLGS